MTVTVTPTTTPPGRQHWSRRRGLGAAVLALVLVLAVVGVLTVRHLEGQYGPVAAGPTSGPYAGFPNGQLAATPGASGELFATLSNYGSHAVTVTGLSYPQWAGVVTGVRWSAWKLSVGGSSFGANVPWRSFPATIPGNATIWMLISVRRPADCAKFLGVGTDGQYFDGAMVVRWKSLLHTHSTAVTLLNPTVPVKVC